MLARGGGGGLVFQAGYHPHKRTFKTHPKHIFLGTKIDPKYAFLHAVHVFFPKFLTMAKNTPFFPILQVFARGVLNFELGTDVRPEVSTATL